MHWFHFFIKPAYRIIREVELMFQSVEWREDFYRGGIIVGDKNFREVVITGENMSFSPYLAEDIMFSRRNFSKTGYLLATCCKMSILVLWMVSNVSWTRFYPNLFFASVFLEVLQCFDVAIATSCSCPRSLSKSVLSDYFLNKCEKNEMCSSYLRT